MKKLIVNIAMILIAFAIQSCIFPFIPFLSASPNFMLILVFSYGFIYGRREGILYGLLAGVLMDLFYSGPLGFFSLIYIWIGYVNGMLSKFYYEDYIVLPLIMCTINELVYNFYLYIFRFLIRGKTNFLFYSRTIVVPEIIITLLFTLILYRILLAYGRKLDEIEKKRGTKIVS